ncbi:MAG: hypothetical protein F6K15_09410 [Okeania sp. SIO2B3]|nr:hypothetical protein [Okeania sp. SIO2B3]
MPTSSTTEKKINFSVIKENYPSINCEYFQNMTNIVRDFSAGKFCEILPKTSTTEKETNFSVIKENLPLINSRYFGQVINRIRDFFCDKIIWHFAEQLYC